MRSIYSIKTLIYTCVCLVITVIAVEAQPISRVKYEVMLATADELMESGDYYNALTWYRDAYTESKAPDLALSAAYAYYKLRDFKNAERWYGRILDKDSDNVFIDDRYAYGRTLRSMGNFEKAIEQFNMIRELSGDQVLISGANQELKGMAATPSYSMNEDVLVSFASDKINNGTGEYSPVQYDENTVYFTSFQSRKETVLDGSEDDYTAKVYTTTRTEGEYGKPEALGRVINRDDYHVGNVAFSQDKRTMFFSRQTIVNDQVTSSKIYRSSISGDEWSAAEPMCDPTSSRRVIWG